MSLDAIVKRKKVSGPGAVALLQMLRGPATVWKFSRGPREIAGSTKAALADRGYLRFVAGRRDLVELTDLGRAVALDMLDAYRFLADKTPRDGWLGLWAAFAEADATVPIKGYP